jgi:fermentation-respiration switch protein FrsA (DUF1100 family)
MQHSVKYIAEKYSEFSRKRNDKNLFIAEDFIRFAQDNKEKYSLIENGDDLLVSTWYSNDLIEAYRNKL